MATPRVLRLDLTRPLVDARPTDVLGAVQARKRPVFAEVVAAIRRVATSDHLSGLVARVGGSAPAVGAAHAQELRDAVLAVRAAGKPTIGFAETFGEFGPGTVAYALGAAFEELWLQPSGDIGLTGISLQTAFAREAVDRLGLQPRVGQRQEYKNAPDTLLRDGYSEPHREALFLPLGHDLAAAAALRAQGWRTVAALSQADEARSLGCSHVLQGSAALPL